MRSTCARSSAIRSFVAELHLGLARDEAGQHVLAESKIAGGGDCPGSHARKQRNQEPEHDRPEANCASGMDESVTVTGAPPRDSMKLWVGGMGTPTVVPV